MENSEIEFKSKHWDNFYSSDQLNELRPPSQFGAFIIGEISKDTIVIDIGCGNGRDSLFFSGQNIAVVGIDASVHAINDCVNFAKLLNSKALFLNSNINNESLVEKIKTVEEYKQSKSVLVYARFFLHAITETDENALFSFVSSIGENRTTRFAIEFRTHRDATMPKTTAHHFRRFINPANLMVKAIQLGFKVEYFIEGFGLAKYKEDDAHVARFIFIK